jgi:diacylglycerol kinase (ATP)
VNLIQRRLINTFKYSMAGLRAAWQHEEAVRVETLLLPLVVLGAFYFGKSPIEIILLSGVGFLVIIVELLNSAIEKTVDRISPDIHPLSKYAKDVGSAAVFMSLMLFFLVWGLILFWK